MRGRRQGKAQSLLSVWSSIDNKEYSTALMLSIVLRVHIGHNVGETDSPAFQFYAGGVTLRLPFT